MTGATSGIGRAVALQLTRDGARLVVHSRDAARVAETVEQITAPGAVASDEASFITGQGLNDDGGHLAN